MRWGTLSADMGTTEQRARGGFRFASHTSRRMPDQRPIESSASWDDEHAGSSNPPLTMADSCSSSDAHGDEDRFVIEGQWARMAKRAVDIIVGVPLCVVFLIAYPIVAAILKLTSPGPVLFTQIRVGRGGQRIAVYKFRSMYSDAERRLRADTALYEQYLHNGFKVPSALDPRITRFGRLLRRTSIDELPQALCVLQGTMSAVGPRPVVPDELIRLYGDSPRAYLSCKPGLTGLWQVSGRSQVLFEHRVRLDATYAAEWSLRGDVRILARTIPVVLTAHGAH